MSKRGIRNQGLLTAGERVRQFSSTIARNKRAFQQARERVGFSGSLGSAYECRPGHVEISQNQAVVTLSISALGVILVHTNQAILRYGILWYTRWLAIRFTFDGYFMANSIKIETKRSIRQLEASWNPDITHRGGCSICQGIVDDVVSFGRENRCIGQSLDLILSQGRVICIVILRDVHKVEKLSEPVRQVEESTSAEAGAGLCRRGRGRSIMEIHVRVFVRSALGRHDRQLKPLRVVVDAKAWILDSWQWMTS